MNPSTRDAVVTDPKDFFDRLGKVSPRIDVLPDGVTTILWENLYQAFAQRFREESRMLPLPPQVTKE